MKKATPFRYMNEQIGFYIAAGDQELLAQVKKLMSRNGCLGVMDTAGRVQYLIDGRMGSPFAARRIMETADRLLLDRQAHLSPFKRCLGRAVDQVLSRHNLRPELKGYRYLRYMLLLAGDDETCLRPVSKTLYPAAADHFRVKVSQVERDIRYAIQQSDFRRTGLTGAAAICRMHDEIMGEAERLAEIEISSANDHAGGGLKASD
ncbi:MAG: sporulation initiation factor Spo0A C-terminal domain-containing protein [Saccharofermentanales bacterium]|jgi:hypothetical protein|nr:hypothetical protein [Clostridiaceae bacterium]